MLITKKYAFILCRMFKRLINEYNHRQQLYCCLGGLRQLFEILLRSKNLSWNLGTFIPVRGKAI